MINKNDFEVFFSSVFLHVIFIALFFVGGISQVKKITDSLPTAPIIEVNLSNIKIQKESKIPNLNEEVEKLKEVEEKIDKKKLKEENVKKEKLKKKEEKKEIKENKIVEKVSKPSEVRESSESEIARPQATKKIEKGEHKAGNTTSKNLALSIHDALRVRIRQCWMIDPSRNYPSNMKIRITAFLDQNGAVYKTLAPDSGNQLERYVIGTAVRAVNSCSPFDFLPKDKYEEWKEIEVTFDPATKSVN
ncbi:MAG: hypothetical protein ACTSXL_05955 [Alphaproteobacteria bacterium]